MPSRAVSILHEGPYAAEAVTQAATRLRGELGAPATLALAFVTPDYLPFLDEFSDIIRVDGHVSELVGCTGAGLISDGVEKEGGKGFSLLGLHTANTTVSIHDLPPDLVERASGPDFWKRTIPASEGWLLLANPFAFSVDEFLPDWNGAFGGIATIGGLASGGTGEETMAVFRNGSIAPGAVVIGFQGELKLVPAVSQGCRPIGEPLPVTRAEDNVIFSLGSRPAYQALESAFQSLTESERSGAQGNLFAGLANTEYVEEFRPGDFLIRNIIGADPNSGAVVIAGLPRIGQTVQYQLRDKKAADLDLRRVLHEISPGENARPVASVLFCCLGRGTGLFGRANHDAGTVEELLGRHSSTGFFCNGEIGPVAGKNCVHGYTASCAIFMESGK